jgi:type IV pilus assembly protein PilQ
MHSLRSSRNLLVAALLFVFCGSYSFTAQGQDRPERRNTRTNISPELLVSFGEDTSLNQLIEILNPLFEKELGKRIVDPEDRSIPIGVTISGMYYFDAFRRALEVNDLTYRETEDVFLVQEPSKEDSPEASPGGSSNPDQKGPLATIDTREIRINAILFNLNLTKVRNLGLRWDEILGSTQGAQGGQGGSGGRTGGTGSAGGQQGQQQNFAVKTESLFESVDNILQAPDQISLSRFRRFLNVLEEDDIGRTVANPQVTVQSGEKGNIQIGQDVPIQTTDFAGNTVTEFFSTGIIIDVTPTLLTQPVADTTGAPELDFIHLDVDVEDSNSQPTGSGPVINRNQASTQVLLLDDEATAIGGLISTQKTTTRSGVPILKDLPGWFFGLRYIFGSETTNVTKQELLIVLRAEVVDPLRSRAKQKQSEDLLDKRRGTARETLRRLGEKQVEEADFPEDRSRGDLSSSDRSDGNRSDGGRSDEADSDEEGSDEEGSGKN